MRIRLYSFVLLIFFPCFCNSQNREKAIEKQKEAVNMHMNAIFKEGHNQDSIQKSISLLDESIALDSTYLLAYFSKVQFLDEQGRFTESIAAINSALRHQEDPGLYFVRGILNEKLNYFDASKSDYSKAISLFDKMIEKDTNNFYALSNRAFVLYLYENENVGIQALEKIRDKPLNEVEKKQLDVMLKMVSESGRDEIIKNFN
jgi:tetratricopeptide (TPR) repeat protein